ncbi:MAG: iron-sulfur cluster assembly protein IscA [Zetaproteobacteria bacterium CG_4_9_14_3_um_filter_53_7]|nr:MAG: iron-sulfur cluster assembly protein IscA [Zetaproteobacteria bacterium CG_4_9_14_3_um_filter_53_7]
MIDIELTPAAIKRVQAILAAEDKLALRLAVKAAGCSGLEYVMETVEEAHAGDLVKSFDGFDLYVDADSYNSALRGLHLDFQQDLMSSAFVYNNPNQKGACGCGVSFSV